MLPYKWWGLYRKTETPNVSEFAGIVHVGIICPEGDWMGFGVEFPTIDSAAQDAVRYWRDRGWNWIEVHQPLQNPEK